MNISNWFAENCILLIQTTFEISLQHFISRLSFINMHSFIQLFVFHSTSMWRKVGFMCNIITQDRAAERSFISLINIYWCGFSMCKMVLILCNWMRHNSLRAIKLHTHEIVKRAYEHNSILIQFEQTRYLFFFFDGWWNWLILNFAM